MLYGILHLISWPITIITLYVVVSWVVKKYEQKINN